MLRIAIVEDEDVYAKQLERYLDQYQTEKGVEIRITRFTDGDEITESYRAAYDIILMDIQMRFMDGMTAAEQIRQMDSEVVIMFITNMTEYAVRGYEVDALDYVVKPIEYFAFSRKMDRAVARIKPKERNFISVLTENGMRKIDLDTVLYMEIQDHTLIYHTKTESVASRGRGIMREMEQMMTPYGFFRSSNCYLVNLKWVESVEDGACILDGQALPISRSKRKAFMIALVQSISRGDEHWKDCM